MLTRVRVYAILHLVTMHCKSMYRGGIMKINKELLKGSTAIMILKIICEEDSYGYQITQNLIQKSNNLFKLNEGTLYPILHAMEKEGLINSYKKESESGRERKYYSITASGRIKLSSLTEEWEVFSQTVSSILKREV